MLPEAEVLAWRHLRPGEGDNAKTNYPIIATHVGMRSAGPAARAQEYNLADDTARKIAERGGVIGLISAQHQLGDAHSEADSAALVKAHLDAIGAAVGDASSVAALGTDIDGFIKPTLKDLRRRRTSPSSRHGSGAPARTTRRRSFTATPNG